MIGKSPHSPLDVRAALESLPELDLVRLKRIAQFASRGLKDWGWEDLFQETIGRGLEGTRAWPAEVPFLTFLVQTMRSVAHEQWEREHRPAAAASAEVLKRSEHAPDVGPERKLAAVQELAEIRSWFAGDPAALAVLDGMERGEGPGEVQRRAKLDERAYKAAQKRIRRTLLKRIGEQS